MSFMSFFQPLLTEFFLDAFFTPHAMEGIKLTKLTLCLRKITQVICFLCAPPGESLECKLTQARRAT